MQTVRNLQFSLLARGPTSSRSEKAAPCLHSRVLLQSSSALQLCVCVFSLPAALFAVLLFSYVVRAPVCVYVEIVCNSVCCVKCVNLCAKQEAKCIRFPRLHRSLAPSPRTGVCGFLVHCFLVPLAIVYFLVALITPSRLCQ